jgi:hypothetical protein
VNGCENSAANGVVGVGRSLRFSGEFSGESSGEFSGEFSGESSMNL